jgi:hypothetical protein
VTVWRIAPEELSFRSVPARMSVVQMLVPSWRTPYGTLNPREIVVTVHGRVAPGVTIETEPESGDPSATFVVQIRPPSKAIPVEVFPSVFATVVTAPAGWLGSIR